MWNRIMQRPKDILLALKQCSPVRRRAQYRNRKFGPTFNPQILEPEGLGPFRRAFEGSSRAIDCEPIFMTVPIATTEGPRFMSISLSSMPSESGTREYKTLRPQNWNKNYAVTSDRKSGDSVRVRR
jgi:hypothetical protein